MVQETTRPWRSVLYVPGSNVRALEKARSLPVDAFIFDLEDAVAVSEKALARETLADAPRGGDFGDRAVIVRINGFDTEWGDEDFDVISRLSPEAILLPKVERFEDVAALSALLDTRPECKATRIWAMMETAGAQFHVHEVAKGPRLAGFIIGTNDLAAELGCVGGDDRLPMMAALQSYLAAARANGLICVDGVYNRFRDEEGLRAECVQGRRLGMDGKTVIHPAQIGIANEVFTPSDAEVELADRQILAWQEAQRSGQGVAVVDETIVENLHVRTARSVLARAAAARQRAQP